MIKHIILIFLIVILIFVVKNKLQNEYFKNPNSLIVILPVRDRENNLKQYLKNMIPIFEYQNIDYKIFIVEQNKGKRFNKAKDK